MSLQKQNFLWLTIVCCASHQISCSKKIIVGDNLTDTCFRDSSKTDIKLTCLSACDTEIKDVCTMNVRINTSSLGPCKDTTNRKHCFNITNDKGKYEVRMNETDKDIQLWFLPNESKCQQSTVNQSGSSKNIVTCQIKESNSSITTTTTPNCKPPGQSHPDCLKIPPVDDKTCEKAEYDDDTCNRNEKSTYILSLNGSNWKCVNCDKTPTYNLTVDPSILDTSDTLKTKMLEMEKNNISSARIVIGDVIGLLHIQPKNTETKESCYSSDQDKIKVVDCQSDLMTDIPWSIKIPSEAFNKSRLENNGSAFFVAVRYKNFGKDETKINTVLNNEVYGITMWAKISNLTNNIEMNFTNNNLDGEASCTSWDGKGNLGWTTSGCKTEKINNNTIKCSCSHLTFFAVLMSPPDIYIQYSITEAYVDSLSFITSIGCGISMFFLSVALFMHFLLRKAKSNQATKILINMCVALFLLNLSFLSNESVANTEVKAACVFIALLMHYSMLTTFTWFFIQALHMYLWLIRQNVTITNYMRKITVFGWTLSSPIVVAVVSVGGYKVLIINTTSGNTAQMCWITDPLIHYIVNIGYYTFVFIFTTGIFIMIVTKIVQARHIRAPDGKRKTFRKQLMMVLSLFLLFGLTWAVAFFSYGEMLIPSYYIFTVLNSFQGFFLFLYYYHIHNDIEGHFSDDPEVSDSSTTIIQSRNNAVENVYNEPN
ncbi:adhesion G-protein coupled receptor G2-like [Megalobrama amblycephala]|uniref:adhesion G-protein coupled receptor G2-like n=1 Tax=Megalobrama amblycephala TaxID=75352 RepID=UPI0020141C8D|nr:adhesion G-protein coupled receptor G2-like [Megalobrama amblycephala]